MSDGDFDHIPEAIKAIHEGVRKAVKKAAFDIEAKAKGWAPIDTGFLKNSVYSVTVDSSDYAQASQRAHGKDEFRAMLPEMPKPESDTTAIVAVGAEYGEYIEYGTRHMPAQPFLTPSADAVRDSFQKVIARLVAAELKAVAKGDSEAS